MTVYYLCLPLGDIISKSFPHKLSRQDKPSLLFFICFSWLHCLYGLHCISKPMYQVQNKINNVNLVTNKNNKKCVTKIFESLSIGYLICRLTKLIIWPHNQYTNNTNLSVGIAGRPNSNTFKFVTALLPFFWLFGTIQYNNPQVGAR